MHVIWVHSYESLHGVATIHNISEMTCIIGGTLYLQSMTFFITCCSCLEPYCLMGNFLLVSCLEAFSGNLSSFFKIVHTIVSCSLSFYHIFILSFSLSSFSSPLLPASTHTHTHTIFLHHVVCSSVWVFQRNLLLSYGKVCRQHVSPNNGDLSTNLYCENLKSLSLFWFWLLYFAVFLRCH